MLGKLLSGWLKKDPLDELRRRTPAGGVHLSVVICSHRDERFRGIEAQLRERLARWPHELIRIADARSLAEGYNRGLDRARGEWLLFCHDDIELLQEDFDERLLAHLEDYDVLGVAGATRLRNATWIGAGAPHLHGQVLHPLEQGSGYMLSLFCRGPHAPAAERQAIQALDGLFIAARRTVVEQLRFDEDTFDGFHLYDVDFSFRAHLMGYRVGVCHDILLCHQSLGSLNEDWSRYCRIFEDKFKGQLSGEPAGPMRYHQIEVKDKAEALAVFQRALEEA